MDKQVQCSTAVRVQDHWIKQPGLLLSERGARSGARSGAMVCNTMELAREATAMQQGVTESHLVDPARRLLLAKSLEQERPHNFLVHSEMWIPQTVDNRRTETRRPEEREKRRRLRLEYQGVLNWHACKQVLEGRTLGKARPQRGISITYKKECQKLGLNITTTSGCALGLKHPAIGNLVGQHWRIASTSKRLLDRVTHSCQEDHQHHEAGSSYITFGVGFPDSLARSACGARLWNLLLVRQKCQSGRTEKVSRVPADRCLEERVGTF